MVKQFPGSLLPHPVRRRSTRQDAAPETPWVFVRSGGALCQDFANTLSWRQSAQPVERLTSYHRFVSWAEQSGAIPRGIAARLRRGAARRPIRAAQALTHGVVLREAVFQIFAAAVARRAVPARAMALLNRVLHQAWAHRAVRAVSGRFTWTWTGRDELDQLLWPVAVSAAALLLSEQRRHIRLCAAENCGWIFLDTTRNRSRRWCSMQVCGNRAKVRQHYWRSKRRR